MVDTRDQLGAPQVPHSHSAVAPGDLAHDETLWDQTLRL